MEAHSTSIIIGLILNKYPCPGRLGGRGTQRGEIIPRNHSCDVVIPLTDLFRDFHAATILQTRAESVFCFHRKN